VPWQPVRAEPRSRGASKRRRIRAARREALRFRPRPGSNFAPGAVARGISGRNGPDARPRHVRRRECSPGCDPRPVRKSGGAAPHGRRARTERVRIAPGPLSVPTISPVGSARQSSGSAPFSTSPHAASGGRKPRRGTGALEKITVVAAHQAVKSFPVSSPSPGSYWVQGGRASGSAIYSRPAALRHRPRIAACWR